MQWRNTWCVLTAAWPLLWSCGGASREPSSSAGTTPNAGRVSLTVHAAEERSSVSGVAAGQDETYAWIDVTIMNGSSASIAVAPTTLRLQTNEGLEFFASALSASIEGACPAAAFLSANQATSCSLVFELARQVAPTRLIYTGVTDAGNVAESLRVEVEILAFARCDRCDDVCTDLSSSAVHCGACGVTVPSGGACVEGAPSCPNNLTFDNGRCVDLSSDDNNCGTPGNRCNQFEDCIGGRCSCTPDCSGNVCGPDGCGGACGSCNASEVCVEGACLNDDYCFTGAFGYSFASAQYCQQGCCPGAPYKHYRPSGGNTPDCLCSPSCIPANSIDYGCTSDANCCPGAHCDTSQNYPGLCFSN